MQDHAYLIDLDANTVTFTDTGEVAPITNAYDAEGDECPICNAVSLVAGPFAAGWLALDMSETDPVVLH